ncbi:hypothetical protein F5X98DRAFT_381766 [Xylaria grammica]|nr:hypothetical protein F5X98DRAFT_381766 [Xylaria grammica]
MGEQNSDYPVRTSKVTDDYHATQSSEPPRLVSTPTDSAVEVNGDDVRPISEEEAVTFRTFIDQTAPLEHRLEHCRNILIRNVKESNQKDFYIQFRDPNTRMLLIRLRPTCGLRAAYLLWDGDSRDTGDPDLISHIQRCGFQTQEHIKQLIPLSMQKLDNPSHLHHAPYSILQGAHGIAYGQTWKGNPKIIEHELNSTIAVHCQVPSPTEIPFQGQIWILRPLQFISGSFRHRLRLGISLQLVAFVNSFFGETSHERTTLPEFISSFINPSYPRPLLPSKYISGRACGMTALQCRIHYFTPIDNYLPPIMSRYGLLAGDSVEPYLESPEPEGFILNRQRAKLRRGNGFVHFCEKVSSFCLLVGETTGNPYIVLVLTDDNYYHFSGDTKWEEYGLSPCGAGIGVTQFLATVLLVLKEWERGWMSTLDSIDSIVRVQLHDFLEEEDWINLMFDDSFRLSKNYFSILQLLRIIGDLVERLEQDLKNLRARYYQIASSEDLIEKKDLLELNTNWDKVQSIVEMRAKVVRDRTARKTEEIKSLRDGLFNATSLRESTKSMALNRAIYVFTVITVIYTPVGFLATFWALPFLNNSSESSHIPEATAFRNTFIIIPLLTYGLAIAVAFYFGSETAKHLTKAAKIIILGMLRILTIIAKNIISGAVKRLTNPSQYIGYDWSSRKERVEQWLSERISWLKERVS